MKLATLINYTVMGAIIFFGSPLAHSQDTPSQDKIVIKSFIPSNLKEPLPAYGGALAEEPQLLDNDISGFVPSDGGGSSSSGGSSSGEPTQPGPPGSGGGNN